MAALGTVAALAASGALLFVMVPAYAGLGALWGAAGALEDTTSEKVDAIFSAEVWSRLGDRIPRFPGRRWIGRKVADHAKDGLTALVVAKVIATLQLVAIKGLGRFAVMPMLALCAGGTLACLLSALLVAWALDLFCWLAVPALGGFVLLRSRSSIRSLLVAAAGLAEDLAVRGATAVASGVSSVGSLADTAGAESTP